MHLLVIVFWFQVTLPNKPNFLFVVGLLFAIHSDIISKSVLSSLVSLSVPKKLVSSA